LTTAEPHPASALLYARPLVVPCKRLNALEREWENLKAREGFTEFHSAECLARNSKSEYANWDEHKVKRVFSRVAQITTKYGSVAVSWAVKKSHYDEVIPEEWRRVGGRFHYTWAVRRVLYMIRDSHPIIGSMASLEYCFDWIDDRVTREEIERVMAQEDSAHPGEYEGRYSFRKRKELPALQCADLLAWSCLQVGRWLFESTPINPVAQSAIGHFGRVRKGEWLRMVTNTRQQLEEIVATNVVDVNSEEARRAWHRKYEARRATARAGGTKKPKADPS
jgi:hypothetical protein